MAYTRAIHSIRTEISVTSGEAPKRLDVFLSHHEPALSRSAVRRLIDEGRITVNGQPAKASYKIRPGDRIVLDVPRPEPLDLRPEPIPLDVLHEDDHILVINKPAGLVVHPAPGHWSGTLVNALLHHFGTTGGLSMVGGKERPGLVHRLDKETSGVMVIAKTDQAHRHLAAQFKHHTISRVYEAIAWGVIKKSAGLIELAIGRDTRERKKFSARTSRPRESATEYRVVERLGKQATWVALHPRSGRTHQIRVHLTAIGNPILGDPMYGGRKVRSVEDIPIKRVMLHARTLGFRHPATGKQVEFSAPLPADMDAVLASLRAAGSVRTGRSSGRGVTTLS